jgi:galactokinase
MTAQPAIAVPRSFQAHFGAAPQIVARAPGRVNLIGEHTDYNNGFVLPAAIDRAVYIAASVRSDSLVTVQSLDYEAVTSFSLDALQAAALHESTIYPRGVLHLLRQDGVAIRGLDLTIGSDVPVGAGLSSSAAVGVAMLEVACHLFGYPLSQSAKARLAQRIENEFIGAPTGIMDQMISACGKADHALLIDCADLSTTLVPVPRGVALMVLDTSTRHDHSTSGYAERRAQCEEAARLLGVRSLREVTPETLAANADKLPELVERRAAHVVNENVRTLACVAALQAGDMARVGELVNESHASLSQLFQVSNKELDRMAEIAQRETGCYGARMMGGGFGGAVIALVADSEAAHFAERVAMAYTAATHLKPFIYQAYAADGSGLVQG